MPHVSFRVSEQEKAWMDGYAKLHGVNLSDAIKTAFFEKLEDDYDIKTVTKYEDEKGNIKFYTLDEVKSELGFN